MEREITYPKLNGVLSCKQLSEIKKIAVTKSYLKLKEINSYPQSLDSTTKY